MSITDKTRKVLWGRSGNRCAICKRELVIDATDKDDESVIGDECHIVSGKPDGPRNAPIFGHDEIDAYENLLLLCKVHHKVIDDQFASYPAEELKRIKNEHESWVQKNLNEKPDFPPIKLRRKGKSPPFMIKVSSGKTLFDLLEGTACYSLDNDEPASLEEAELIGDFFQNIKDTIDICFDLEPRDKVREGFLLNKTIKELEDAGFFIFAMKEDQLWIEGGIGAPMRSPLLWLKILRNTNPAISTVDMTKLKTGADGAPPSEG